MRISIANITGGGLSGGYRKYLKNIVPRMLADPRVEAASVFVPEGVRISEISGSVVCEVQRGMRWSSLLRTTKCDVVFIPTARAITAARKPVVSMVRNMEPLLIPFQSGTVRESLRNCFRYLAAYHAALAADRIIAVSNHVADFLSNSWFIGRERIGVVYHGVDEPVPPRTESELLANLRPFILTAGSVRAARGLADIIIAFSNCAKLRRTHMLVIAGGVDSSAKAYAAEMRNLATSLGVADRICWTGQLDSRELSVLYFNCDAFVMTSRAEACPNIALEAMAHGCLCISTDQAPMPEFFGSSAIYYDRGNARSLAAVLAALESGAPDNFNVRRAIARENARRYSWNMTAKKTVDELAIAIARHGGKIASGRI